MMLVEQFMSSGDHSHHHHHPHNNGVQQGSVRNSEEAPKPIAEDLEDDELGVQLDELDGGIWHEGNSEARKAEAQKKAFPLTLGLVIHSLADGLALGASALPLGEGAEASSAGGGLSIVVFLALIIHKGVFYSNL